MATRALHVHASFACAHSGVCCTAGWPIPVEPDRQAALKQMAGDDILFFVNAFGWTYDPRREVSVIPFVTYPFQDRALLALDAAVRLRPAGEAAQLAVDELSAALRAVPAGTEADLPAIIRAINDSVVRLGQQISPQTGIGTTLTAGSVRGGILRIGHVGDSRAYLSRGGVLKRITEDHSVENEIRRRRALGARRPLPAQSYRAQRRLLPLLQRQDRSASPRHGRRLA